ncbi:MAG: EamA family transporter [Ruminococcus sp.]|jgi:transporter family protein
MWMLYAAGSAFFAGITSVLAKCGIRKTDSTVATAIRTVVVLIFSWVIVWIVGSEKQISEIRTETLLFLILSGAATGASWLCYFRALQLGDINKVVPVDKSSTVLTIILALIFLGEGISLPKALAVAAITAGIFLMIEKKDIKETSKAGHGSWILYAAGSAVFASLTAILGKIGISRVESNLGTAIRTVVVLIMAWVMVLITGKQNEVKSVDRKELFFICLSGIATGASWLCYYRALQEGPASVVAPVDKLSVLVTVIFSYLVFGEKLKRRAVAGLVLLTGGTVAMALL